MKKSTQEQPKPPHFETLYKCDHCGREIRGNAYHQHVRACALRPEGRTKTIYPIELPSDLYMRWHAWCLERGFTLAQGVQKLIKDEIGHG